MPKNGIIIIIVIIIIIITVVTMSLMACHAIIVTNVKPLDANKALQRVNR